MVMLTGVEGADSENNLREILEVFLSFVASESKTECIIGWDFFGHRYGVEYDSKTSRTAAIIREETSLFVIGIFLLRSWREDVCIIQNDMIMPRVLIVWIVVSLATGDKIISIIFELGTIILRSSKVCCIIYFALGQVIIRCKRVSGKLQEVQFTSYDLLRSWVRKDAVINFQAHAVHLIGASWKEDMSQHFLVLVGVVGILNLVRMCGILSETRVFSSIMGQIIWLLTDILICLG